MFEKSIYGSQKELVRELLFAGAIIGYCALFLYPIF
jgi:hypothetical protein